MYGRQFESKSGGFLGRNERCSQVADRKRLLLVAFMVWSQIPINFRRFPSWPFCLLTCNIISVTIQAVIKSPSHVPMAATFMNVWFSIPIRLLACILSMYLPSKKNHVSSGICIVNKGLGSLHIISPLLAGSFFTRSYAKHRNE